MHICRGKPRQGLSQKEKQIAPSQNFMQSIFVIAEDVMMIVGPIYGTSVY